VTYEGGRLQADCEQCFGLCCVAPAFAASVDFAINKPAGHPCINLHTEFRCGIHKDLRRKGFRGCAVYDCFGAGQQVSQVTFEGRDWRADPGTAKPMFEVFSVMRQLHELLWYLSAALALPPSLPLHKQLRHAFEVTEGMTYKRVEDLLALDVGAHRVDVNELLTHASELVRAGVPGAKLDRRGADLIGACLDGADLSGANLRGALLIGTGLSGADLRFADVIGADFRDADLRDADLTDTLFLIQSQLDAAKGNAATRLPPSLSRPAHWSASI